MKAATARRLILLIVAACVVIALGEHSSAARASAAESGLRAWGGVQDCDVLYPDAVTRYVQSDADASRSTGARNRPFASLADAEAASGPGDVIMVLHVPAARPALDGGITLKDCQKLLGTGPPVTTASANAARAKITNSTGDVVTLADDNEVAGLHIAGAGGYGIIGRNTTGSSIHDNLLTGWNQLELLEDFPAFAHRAAGRGGITFLADAGAITANTARDNVLRDASSSGVVVLASGSAEATVTVEGSVIENIDGSSFLAGGRNHAIFAAGFDGATVDLTITRTVVDDILNESDGISAFVCAGGGFVCGTVPGTGANVNLEIREFMYRNTSGRGQQGIETLTQPGTRLTLLLENSDIIGTRLGAVVLFNAFGNPGSDVIDLGGGALGSVGQNRFIDNGTDVGDANTALGLFNGDAVAEQNWWQFPEGPTRLDVVCGAPAPPTPAGVAFWVFCLNGPNSSLDFEPFLTEDPRP